MSLMSGEKGDYFATHPLLTEALSGCEDSCDVIGLNYLTGRHVLEHELHPRKAVLAPRLTQQTSCGCGASWRRTLT